MQKVQNDEVVDSSVIFLFPPYSVSYCSIFNKYLTSFSLDILVTEFLNFRLIQLSYDWNKRFHHLVVDDTMMQLQDIRTHEQSVNVKVVKLKMILLKLQLLNKTDLKRKNF